MTCLYVPMIGREVLECSTQLKTEAACYQDY